MAGSGAVAARDCLCSHGSPGGGSALDRAGASGKEPARILGPKVAAGYPLLSRRSHHRQPTAYGCRLGPRDCRITSTKRSIAGFRRPARCRTKPISGRSTPMSVPGGRTLLTQDVANLLAAARKPVVVTTTTDTPTIPGTLFVQFPYAGSLDDVWRPRLERFMRELTDGEMDRPIIVFSFNQYRWYGRNLALRLIALGYKNVGWYRGRLGGLGGERQSARSACGQGDALTLEGPFACAATISVACIWSTIYPIPTTAGKAAARRTMSAPPPDPEARTARHQRRSAPAGLRRDPPRHHADGHLRPSERNPARRAPALPGSGRQPHADPRGAVGAGAGRLRPLHSLAAASSSCARRSARSSR